MIPGKNETVTTQRRAESVTGKQTWDGSNVLTNVGVYLEQVSPDMAVSIDGQFTYDMYKIWLDGTPDIEESDTVTDSQGRVFTVKGVQKFPNQDIGSHTEAVLMLKATNES